MPNNYFYVLLNFDFKQNVIHGVMYRQFRYTSAHSGTF